MLKTHKIVLREVGPLGIRDLVLRTNKPVSLEIISTADPSDSFPFDSLDVVIKLSNCDIEINENRKHPRDIKAPEQNVS